MNNVSGGKKLPVLAIPIPDWPEEHDDDAYGFPRSCPSLNSSKDTCSASTPQYSVWCPPLASPACTISPSPAADSCGQIRTGHPKAEAREGAGNARTVETGGGTDGGAGVPKQMGQQRKLRGKPHMRRLSHGTILESSADALPGGREQGTQRMLTPTPSNDSSTPIDGSPLRDMISPATSSEMELRFHSEADESGRPEDSAGCDAEAGVRNRRKVWRRISLSPHAVSTMQEAKMQEDSGDRMEQAVGD